MGSGGRPRAVVVPTSWLVGAGVVVLIASILVWTVAHNAGSRAERQRIAIESNPPVADPLRGGSDQDNAGTNSAAPGPTERTESSRQQPATIHRDQRTPSQVTPQGGQAGPGGSAAQANQQPPQTPSSTTPAGGLSDDPDESIGSDLPWTFGIDPRQPGSNYLMVVRLPAESAFHAAAFLTANGVPAAALPARANLDPVQALENNADHVVVVLEGIPPGQFSQRAQWRDSLQNRVAEIGRRYKAANVLHDDLARSKHQWARYDG